MIKALILSVAFAALALAQGALMPNSSYFYAPTYPSVTRVGANNTSTGWLAFESTGEVRFVPKAGEEIRIPYRAIKELQYEKTMAQVEKQQARGKKSKLSLPLKMNLMSKHQLTIRYEAPYGPETATLWLDQSNYQHILGTLHSKTGLFVKRTGENSWQ